MNSNNTDPTPTLKGRGVPCGLTSPAVAAPLPSARALLACYQRDARSGGAGAGSVTLVI